MRRLFFALLAATAVAGGGATAALADSPHFISASDSVNGAGALVASFKEAGLGNTAVTEQVTLTADGTAVYACINGGGNHPQAANKETVSGPVRASGFFPVRNGQTTGSLTAGPPSAGSFSCPSGQQLVLASVAYSQVQVVGLQGDSASLPDASRTFFAV
jgi:hypothetical protein